MTLTKKQAIILYDLFANYFHGSEFVDLYEELKRYVESTGLKEEVDKAYFTIVRTESVTVDHQRLNEII